jgi:DHA1 family multidrug resistance protein-like MFS transporter
VDEVWQFVALRFAMGAFAGTMGAAAALVAATTPRAKVGPALGALQTAMFSANMLGPVLGGEVAQSLGIRESFVFCSLLFLSACLLAWLFVREEPIEPVAAGKRTEGLLGNLRLVLRERQVVLMLGLLFCLWLSTTFVRPLLAISIDGFATGGHVALHLGFTEIDLGEKRAASYVFAALGLTSVIAAIVIGRAGTAFGYKRCIVVAAIGTGGLFLPVAVAPNYTWFFLLFAATGVFQGAMVPGMNALIAANTPEGKQGSAFGLAASMQSAALMIGPLAGGAVTATLGIEWDYAIIGFILLIAATVAALWVRDVRPQQPTA